MSAFSGLLLVPASTPAWSPDLPLLGEVAQLLKIATVDKLVASQRPLLWEDEDNTFSPVHQEYRVPLHECLSRHEAWIAGSDAPATIQYLVACNRWTKAVSDQLSEIVREVRGEFCPSSVSLTVGPESVPSLDQQGTAGVYHFVVSVNGPGMPIKIDDYLREVKDVPMIAELIRFLESKSGQQFDTLLYATY